MTPFGHGPENDHDGYEIENGVIHKSDNHRFTEKYLIYRGEPTRS